MKPSNFSTVLMRRFLCITGMLLVAVSAQVGPDGTVNSGISSSLYSTDTTTPPDTTSSSSSSSSPSSASSSVSSSGTSSISSGGTVPVNQKSPLNPYWNQFLQEVANQTSRTLESLQANAVNDLSIGIMWDVYVTSIGDGSNVLPTGGGATDTGSSGGATDAGGYMGGAADPSIVGGADATMGGAIGDTGSTTTTTSGGGGTTDTSGSVTSSASAPSINQDWFQSFFNSPTSSASQPSPTSSLDQMFSSFNSPTSASLTAPTLQSQLMYQQQQQQPLQFDASAVAQQIYSNTMQTMQAATQQQQQASAPANYKAPDASWGFTGPTQDTTPAPGLSQSELNVLGNELLSLLGHTVNTAVASPTATTGTSSSQTQTQTQTQTQPQTQTQTTTNNNPLTATQIKPETQTQRPLAPTQTTFPPMTQPPPPMPSATGQQGGIPPLPALPFLPANNIQGANLNHFGLPPSALGALGLGNSMAMHPMKPVLELYNARFNAGASRDLGCRTLGELIDLDVPRPLNLNCPRMCPSMLGRVMTGKRFGLTCLCCPIYVSDQAIGLRSMMRRAESLA